MLICLEKSCWGLPYFPIVFQEGVIHNSAKILFLEDTGERAIPSLCDLGVNYDMHD
jgi:hypothetical protein